MKMIESSLEGQRKIIKMLKAENAKLKKENLVLHNNVKFLTKQLNNAFQGSNGCYDLYKYDDEYY